MINNSWKKPLIHILIPLGIKLILILDIPFYYLVYRTAQIDLIVTTSISTAYIYAIGFTFQFAYATLACRDRFHAINEHLMRKKSLCSTEVHACMELSRMLLLILDHINEFLAFPLIPTFTFFLISETFMAYTVIRLFLKTAEYKVFMIIVHCIWSFIFIYLMMFAAHAAESVLREGRKFKDTLYEALIAKKIPQESNGKLELFLSSITDVKLQLRTTLFDINWKLVVQVNLMNFLHYFWSFSSPQCISSTTMFIIITIQFDTTLPAMSINFNSTDAF